MTSDIAREWKDADAHRRNQMRHLPVVPSDYPDPVAVDWPDLLGIVLGIVRNKVEFEQGG